MKIIVCGKGGSGKSTLSVLLGKAFSSKGYRPILVDADESNMGFAAIAGVRPPVSLLAYLGGKKGFKQKLNAPSGLEAVSADLFETKRPASKIPGKCVAESGKIRLMTVGKIEEFGEGCACPIGILAKRFISGLLLEKDEVLIVDTEAGVEHFGRGIGQTGDLWLMVIDPTAESFRLAKRVQTMARSAGKPLRFVLNKVESEIRKAMLDRLPSELVLAEFPKDDSIFLASLEGRGIDIVPKEANILVDKLVEGMSLAGNPGGIIVK